MLTAITLTHTPLRSHDVWAGACAREPNRPSAKAKAEALHGGRVPCGIENYNNKADDKRLRNKRHAHCTLHQFRRSLATTLGYN